MNSRTRPIVAVLSAALVIGFAVLIVVRGSAPSGERELRRLVAEFMKILPDGTTAAEEEEIRGIMNRFHAKAVAGKVDAGEIAAIESDMRAYVARGGIEKKELFSLMSKVGHATRGTKPPPAAEAKRDSVRDSSRDAR